MSCFFFMPLPPASYERIHPRAAIPYFYTRDVLWFRIIVITNFDFNAMKKDYIFFRWISNFSLWYNRQVIFYVVSVDLVICLRSMNWLHDTPLEIRHFCIIKKRILRTLLHPTNAMLRGKELNIREIYMEEILNWYFHPIPT